MPESSETTLHDRILQYLDSQVVNGQAFVKSRHIAAAIDASAKRVGVAMSDLETQSTEFEFQRWGGGSDGITWFVEKDSPQ